MKLELKHLAPYLPYGLKGVNRNGTIFLLHTNTSSGGKLEKREISIFLSEEFKPILSPLSDLTKEIEVNGEKFVPLNKIRLDFDLDFETENRDYVGLHELLEDYFKLIEWHFDVFGLIPLNLAIDINTL